MAVRHHLHLWRAVLIHGLSDAAQARGEVGQRTGRPQKDVADDNDFRPATAADLGLRRDEIHEARQFHNAEKESPGIVQGAIDEMLKGGGILSLSPCCITATI
jgi:hypothetical protein